MPDAVHRLVADGCVVVSYTGTPHWWSPEADGSPAPPGYVRAVCGVQTPMTPDRTQTNPNVVICRRCRSRIGQ